MVPQHRDPGAPDVPDGRAEVRDLLVRPGQPEGRVAEERHRHVLDGLEPEAEAFDAPAQGQKILVLPPRLTGNLRPA